MDTSETYIEMCDCSEIQDNHKRQVGDWVADLDEDGKWSASPITLVMPTFMGYYDNMVYLPLQGQLQGILGDIGLQTLTWQIHQFSETEYGSGFTVVGTMEQLWLAFVMHSLYQKSWNGTEWIKEG